MKDLIKAANEQLSELLLNALGHAVGEGELPAEPIPAYSIQIPADKSHGDFAANIAMVSARAFKMPPRKIAEAIVKHLVLDGSYFERAEIAGAGFINLFLSHRWFEDAVLAVAEEGENYGRSDYGKGRKVMVEFVSANPTGPMHIGNARGGVIGDSLAAVLDHAGYDVTKEFYVNDAGNQINKFALSLEVRYLQLYKGEEAVPLPEDAYHGADITEHAKAFAAIHGDSYLDKPEEERRKALVDYALPLNIAGLKRDLSRYGIEYDVWFKESTLHQSGAVQQAIDKLTERGYTYEKDGAVWYKNADILREQLLAQGKSEAEIEKLDLKDDVLVRANGTPTYFAADIAYHYNKFAVRGFDKVINIWGADHHGHVARLKGAMDAIGLDGNKLDVVLMQLVRLMRDGETVRVSKRTGKSLTLTDLLDEVPVDAARFFFNLREASSHFDFDLGLAVEQSSQNPVYYVQYAHARICSILSNLAAEGIAPEAPARARLALLTAPEEIELIRFLAGYTNEIIEAAKNYDPSRMTRYAMDLAALFHKFYNACRVKCDQADLMQARLALCLAVKTVLSNLLHMLHIAAPVTM
ncbi:MAG: arginine--tRNA ligase [Oscillospiraceae bacterium]|jgi:arginyl-tRNA synthetase